MDTNVLLERGTAAPALSRLMRPLAGTSNNALASADSSTHKSTSNFKSLLLASSSAASSQSTGQKPGLAAANSTAASAPAAASTSRPIASADQGIIVHSPFGDIYIPSAKEIAAGLTSPTKNTDINPKSWYFFDHPPTDYMSDPSKMAEFGQIYGAKALSVLKQFGTVPENRDPNLLANADQKAMFREDGVRVSYSVIELLNMEPVRIAKYVDVPLSQLDQLFWNGQYEVKFQTKASATV